MPVLLEELKERCTSFWWGLSICMVHTYPVVVTNIYHFAQQWGKVPVQGKIHSQGEIYVHEREFSEVGRSTGIQNARLWGETTIRSVVDLCETQ